jgi:hypothetical protein
MGYDIMALGGGLGGRCPRHRPSADGARNVPLIEAWPDYPDPGGPYRAGRRRPNPTTRAGTTGRPDRRGRGTGRGVGPPVRASPKLSAGSTRHRTLLGRRRCFTMIAPSVAASRVAQWTALVHIGPLSIAAGVIAIHRRPDAQARRAVTAEPALCARSPAPVPAETGCSLTTKECCRTGVSDGTRRMLRRTRQVCAMACR